MTHLRLPTRTLLAVATLCWAFTCLSVSAKAGDEHQIALDKAYQQVLYAYFQGDFYQALTQFSLLERQHGDRLDQVTNPGVDPRLLKGGISLAWGLEEQAAGIFQRLLDSPQSDPQIRTQAWWLLAKAFYQKRQYQQAYQVLQRLSATQVEEHLDDFSQDEWVYLNSQLFEYADNQAQTDWLAMLSAHSVFHDYVAYNQGLAALQQNQLAQASQLLRSVGHRADQNTGWFSSWWSPLQLVAQQELAALQDRANLTLGYGFLQQQDSNNASAAFSQVRVGSLDTQAAMLGMGWAVAHRKEYQAALAVWAKLQAMTSSSEYVHEAYLASAYAFEQAQAPIQALDVLQQGMQRYQREQASLLRLQNQVNDDLFLAMADPDATPDTVPAFFQQAVLSKDFRAELAGLQESLVLQHQLQHWQQRLNTFDLMLDERQQEAVRRSEHIQQNQLLDRLADLEAKRALLAQQVEKAPRDPWVLLNEQELAWQSRLLRAQAKLAHINQVRAAAGKAPLKPAYAERLKRLEGVLYWQVADSAQPRLREVQKILTEVDMALAKTTAQQGILEARLQRMPAYSAQRQRIAELDQRVDTQLSHTQILMEGQLARLNARFHGELDQQLALLKQYQLQAQLAIVRINDDAYRHAQAVVQQGGQASVD